jgi:hypothetical protein
LGLVPLWVWFGFGLVWVWFPFGFGLAAYWFRFGDFAVINGSHRSLQSRALLGVFAGVAGLLAASMQRRKAALERATVMARLDIVADGIPEQREIVSIDISKTPGLARKNGYWDLSS